MVVVSVLMIIPRAYIAASRRSDRSLEARVESARRASEIHKRRTGRSLRVTEQDVINEEMYEEEDDDLPMQYRRLTAHLQTQNAHFDRRLQSYLAQHMAMRSAYGQAVADAYQSSNQGQFINNDQFMNPGMMQMPPAYQQSQMMPPQQTYSRMSSNYRQTPYPMPSQPMQNMQPHWQNRSVSVASPHDMKKGQSQQQQSLSAQTSPIEPVKMEDRRMSLPVQHQMPHTPQSQTGPQQATSPQQVSPAMSRHGSTSNLATPQAYYKQSQSPQQVPTPPRHQPQPPPQQDNSLTSPFSAAFEHQMAHGFNPLSMSLPMESQQLLAGTPAFDMSDPMAAMFMPSQVPSQVSTHHGMKSQQPFYSYNPNGKPKINHNSNSDASHAATEGLSQTLAPASLDTNVSSFNYGMFMSEPQSAATDYLNTPFTPVSLGMGFDNGFGIEPLKGGNGFGNHSGYTTPDEDWSNILNQDIFAEQPVA